MNSRPDGPGMRRSRPCCLSPAPRLWIARTLAAAVRNSAVVRTIVTCAPTWPRTGRCPQTPTWLILAPGMVVDANELSVRAQHAGDQQGRGRQHAGDAARPLGRPNAARPNQRPMAGAAPVTRQGSGYRGIRTLTSRGVRTAALSLQPSAFSYVRPTGAFGNWTAAAHPYHVDRVEHASGGGRSGSEDGPATHGNLCPGLRWKPGHARVAPERSPTRRSTPVSMWTRQLRRRQITPPVPPAFPWLRS
jgi:hypothetical protein